MSGATIVGKVTDPTAEVGLIVATDSLFTAGVVTVPATNTDADGVVRFDVTGLTADTDYYYALVVNDFVDGLRGNLHTAPAALAAKTFTFGAASCTNAGVGGSGPNGGEIFQYLKTLGLAFYVHMGDLHYADIATNDPALFRTQYGNVLSNPGQGAFWRSLPVFYMWDDHDFGPDGADRTNPARDAAHTAYRQCVPHPPLAAGDSGSNGVYYSFAYGRTFFVVTDERSQSDPIVGADNGSMLGAAQKAWFKQTLLDAKAAGYKLIVWVSTRVWIGDTAAADSWGKFATERLELGNFFKDNGLVPNMLQLAGDAHEVAIDDGTNNVYNDAGTPMFPVAQLAPMKADPKVRGGPFTSGIFGGDSRFGKITVTDTGGSTVAVHIDGIFYDNGNAHAPTVLCSLDFTAG